MIRGNFERVGEVSFMLSVKIQVEEEATAHDVQSRLQALLRIGHESGSHLANNCPVAALMMKLRQLLLC